MPQQRVKVFSVAYFCFWVAELAAKKIHAEDGEYEDEQHEETEEDGNIVHCAEHHNQLSAEIWEETNKLENSQQAESPKQEINSDICVLTFPFSFST